MRRRPAPRCWRRSPRPTGSTPLMTAMPGASGSTPPFPTCSSARSRRSGWRPAPRPTASRSPRSARRTARSSATATPISRIDECGAPEFYTGGAKLLLGEGEGAKLTPETRGRRCSPTVRRRRPPGPAGRALDHQRHRIWLRLHARRDRGARRALPGSAGSASTSTARASPMRWRSLGCAPADLTWRAGVDALSFGFVKNGGLSAECLIFFDPALAAATHYRRKRAGHLLSKGRYLAAQILAMLEGDVWLRNARAANAAAARLAAGGRAGPAAPPVEANEVFVRVTRGRGGGAARAGLRFLRLGPGRGAAGDELGQRPGPCRRARRGDPGAVSALPGYKDFFISHICIRHPDRRASATRRSSSRSS